MIRKLLTLVLLTISVSAFAQDKNFPQWTADEVKKANTAEKVTFMTDTEKEVVYLCNLARLNGAKFWDTYMQKYVKGKNTSCVTSLKQELAEAKDLQMLNIDEGLMKQSASHAEDMGENGMIGHTSSEGNDIESRLLKFYGSTFGGENCDYGHDKAMDIVASLLIDEGVSNYTHRKNILKSKYLAIGVAIRPHENYHFNCVQDFGGWVKNPVKQ